MLTPGANNGLGIRTPLEGDAAYGGMELQILDNEAPIYKDLEIYQYHGSVYGVIPAKRGFLKPTRSVQKRHHRRQRPSGFVEQNRAYWFPRPRFGSEIQEYQGETVEVNLRPGHEVFNFVIWTKAQPSSPIIEHKKLLASLNASLIVFFCKFVKQSNKKWEQKTSTFK